MFGFLLDVARATLRQPLTIALTIAVMLIGALTAIVLVPVLSSTPPADDAQAVAALDLASTATPRPTATEDAKPTSTPRGHRPRPTATTDPSEDEESARSAEPTSPPRRARATRTPTPDLPAPESTSTPELALAPEPVRELAGTIDYLADSGDGLSAWSGSGWTMDGGELINDGDTILGQAWVSGPIMPPPSGDYAIEVEFQIDGIAPTYCKQNFGLVAPAPEGGWFVGGSVLYECDGSGPRARITDVSDWTNSYFQDRELATKGVFLQPGSGWHTLRLVVESSTVMLYLDGEEILIADVDSSGFDNPQEAFGLWSEGVRLTVRRIAVLSLDDSSF